MNNHSMFPQRKQHGFFPLSRFVWQRKENFFKEKSMMVAAYCLTTGCADEQLCWTGTLEELSPPQFSHPKTCKGKQPLPPPPPKHWFLICIILWRLTLKCWKHQASYYVLLWWVLRYRIFQGAWIYVQLCVLSSNDTVNSSSLAMR